MKVIVEVLVLEPITIVDVISTPSWWQRLSGRRSQQRTATSTWPYGTVFVWDDTGRLVDDESLAAIQKAIAAVRVQRRLDEIAARHLCTARHRLDPLG
jgi:hypothetical protein